MIPQNESEPPQPVTEAESLVGVATHDLLDVRACNQAAKMARLIQVVMEHTARYAADAEPALARQFALSAWGIIECLGDLMNARDMVEHEDLEGVDELLTELRALIPANAGAVARQPIANSDNTENL